MVTKLAPLRRPACSKFLDCDCAIPELGQSAVTALGVIGNISHDVISYPDGRRFAVLGGAALRVALAASRAGMAAAPIAVIGDDLAPLVGDERLAALDLASIGVIPGRSCSFHLNYDGDGQLAAAEYDFGASRELTDHALSVLGQHDRYHVCCRRPLDVPLILDRLLANTAEFSADF
jgi:hypothetical protein